MAAHQRGTAVAVAVVVVAAGALTLALALRSGEGDTPAGGRAPVLLANSTRPVDPAAVDPLTVTAQNSPTVVTDPRDRNHLALVNRVDLPQFRCELRVSFDAGATWAPVPIPADGACFGPDAAFGADGRLHVAFTTLAPLPANTSNPAALWVVSSSDGGRTLAAPVKVAGPLAFQARLTADPEPRRAGRLYITWVQASGTSSFGFAGTGNPILLSRSDDGGATWSPPKQASSRARPRVVGPVPAVADGTVHVIYLDVGDDALDYDGAHEGRGGDPYPGTWSLVDARSMNGGDTWSESVIDTRVVPTRRFLQLLAPTPSVAVDASRVYVAFTDGRAGDPDIWLWYSADDGRSWRPPVRLNDTAAGDGTTQELPAVAVAPGARDAVRLDVVYLDRRADPADTTTEVSVQSSYDGGRTFTRSSRLGTRPFDSTLGIGRDRGMPDLGSRLGIVSVERGALAVWPDTSHGRPGLEKQVLNQSLIAAPAR